MPASIIYTCAIFWCGRLINILTFEKFTLPTKLANSHWKMLWHGNALRISLQYYISAPLESVYGSMLCLWGCCTKSFCMIRYINFMFVFMFLSHKAIWCFYRGKYRKLICQHVRDPCVNWHLVQQLQWHQIALKMKLLLLQKPVWIQFWFLCNI